MNEKMIEYDKRIGVPYFEGWEERELQFEECSQCDGHDACRDYGCTFENGCGHLVKRDPANMNF